MTVCSKYTLSLFALSCSVVPAVFLCLFAQMCVSVQLSRDAPLPARQLPEQANSSSHTQRTHRGTHSWSDKSAETQHTAADNRHSTAQQRQHRTTAGHDRQAEGRSRGSEPSLTSRLSVCLRWLCRFAVVRTKVSISASACSRRPLRLTRWIDRSPIRSLPLRSRSHEQPSDVVLSFACDRLCVQAPQRCLQLCVWRLAGKRRFSGRAAILQRRCTRTQNVSAMRNHGGIESTDSGHSMEQQLRWIRLLHPSPAPLPRQTHLLPSSSATLAFSPSSPLPCTPYLLI